MDRQSMTNRKEKNMTTRKAAITTALAAIGLAVLAIPAAADEPASDIPSPAVCAEHDDASMPHDTIEEWMGDEITMGDHVQMHDDAGTMMAMTHRAGGAHQVDEDSTPGSHSPMGAGTMMGSAQMHGRSMMGNTP